MLERWAKVRRRPVETVHFNPSKFIFFRAYFDMDWIALAISKINTFMNLKPLNAAMYERIQESPQLVPRYAETRQSPGKLYV